MKGLPRKFAWLLVIAATAIAIAGFAITSFAGAQEEEAEPKPVVNTVIARHALKTAPGMEAVVLYGVFQPGAARAEGEELAHAVDEFIYVLEGSALMTREGEEPITFTEGEAWYNDTGQVHTLQNASTSEPLEVIAIWIGEKGGVWPPE